MKPKISQIIGNPDEILVIIEWNVKRERIPGDGA